jgi:hypothetical protein
MEVVDSLMKRTIAHCSGQKTSGQNTVALAIEGLEAFRDNGNWKPIAYLIGNSENGQQRAVKLITRNVVKGWGVRAAPDTKEKVKFAKIKGENQGFDDVALNKAKGAKNAKLTIQSPTLRDLFTEEKAEKPFNALEKAAADAKRLGKLTKEERNAYVLALQEAVKRIAE